MRRGIPLRLGVCCARRRPDGGIWELSAYELGLWPGSNINMSARVLAMRLLLARAAASRNKSSSEVEGYIVPVKEAEAITAEAKGGAWELRRSSRWAGQLSSSAQWVFRALQASHVPLVFQDGLHDMIRLYDLFVGDVPKNYAKFGESWTNLFPAIFDTRSLDAYFAAEFQDDVHQKLGKNPSMHFKELGIYTHRASSAKLGLVGSTGIGSTARAAMIVAEDFLPRIGDVLDMKGGGVCTVPDVQVQKLPSRLKREDSGRTSSTELSTAVKMGAQARRTPAPLRLGARCNTTEASTSISAHGDPMPRKRRLDRDSSSEDAVAAFADASLDARISHRKLLGRLSNRVTVDGIRLRLDSSSQEAITQVLRRFHRVAAASASDAVQCGKRRRCEEGVETTPADREMVNEVDPCPQHSPVCSPDDLPDVADCSLDASVGEALAEECKAVEADDADDTMQNPGCKAEEADDTRQSPVSLSTAPQTPHKQRQQHGGAGCPSTSAIQAQREGEKAVHLLDDANDPREQCSTSAVSELGSPVCPFHPPISVPTKANRPTVGDLVGIVATAHTMKMCGGIGLAVRIVEDSHDDQPYKVEGYSCWLYDADVKLLIQAGTNTTVNEEVM
jgi:hypothetical protein